MTCKRQKLRPPQHESLFQLPLHGRHHRSSRLDGRSKECMALGTRHRAQGTNPRLWNTEVWADNPMAM